MHARDKKRYKTLTFSSTNLAIPFQISTTPLCIQVAVNRKSLVCNLKFDSWSASVNHSSIEDFGIGTF